MNNRDYSIDNARGIATLLVLLGHIHTTPRYLYVWIYSFHMSLFFLISGMVIKKSDKPVRYLKKKVKGLVVPYFALSIIVWSVENLFRLIVELFRGNFSVNKYINVKELIGIIIGYRLTEYYYIMWYVSATFFAVLLSFSLIRIIKHNFIIMMIGGVLVFINFWIWASIKGFYFSLDAVPLATGLILIGYCFKEYDFLNKLQKKRFVLFFLFLSSIVFSRACYYLYGQIDLYNCRMSDPICFLLLSITGSLTILMFSKKIPRCEKLESISSFSLLFYAFQNKLVIPIC